MRDDRLWEILVEIDSAKLWPLGVVGQEVKYCIDNGLVAIIEGDYGPHAFNSSPPTGFVPWHPTVDELTPKGRQELDRLTERLGLKVLRGLMY